MTVPLPTTCDLCRQSVPPEQLISLGGKTICAQCKPDAVMNLKSGVGMGTRVTPQKAEEIRKRIRNLNLLSFAFGVPGLLLAFGSQGLRRAEDPGSAGAAALVWLVGIALFTTGMVFYARMKGRSGALGLLGLLSCIGLLILNFLPKSCQNCKSKASYRVKECTSCGAPV